MLIILNTKLNQFQAAPSSLKQFNKFNKQPLKWNKIHVCLSIATCPLPSKLRLSRPRSGKNPEGISDVKVSGDFDNGNQTIYIISRIFSNFFENIFPKFYF